MKKFSNIFTFIMLILLSATFISACFNLTFTGKSFSGLLSYIKDSVKQIDLSFISNPIESLYLSVPWVGFDFIRQSYNIILRALRGLTIASSAILQAFTSLFSIILYFIT